MFKLLSSMNKRLEVVIPAALLAGFITGMLVQPAPLKALILPFTFFMVFPVMIGMPFSSVTKGFKPSIQLSAQAINFLIIPFVAWGIGAYFFHDQPALALGLLLASLLPTSGMTISWTGFAGGNISAAVSMTIIGLTAGSFLTPVYLKAMMHTTVQIDLVTVFRQIALVVFLPMAAGFAVRRILLKKMGETAFKEKIAPKLPPLSMIGVIVIIFVAMATKAQQIASHPHSLLSILLPVALLYLINFVISSYIGFRFFGKADGLAMVFGTVMRNLSIALAIAMQAFGADGADAALVVAVSFIIQSQSAAWYVKLVELRCSRKAV